MCLRRIIHNTTRRRRRLLIFTNTSLSPQEPQQKHCTVHDIAVISCAFEMCV